VYLKYKYGVGENILVFYVCIRYLGVHTHKMQLLIDGKMLPTDGESERACTDPITQRYIDQSLSTSTYVLVR
jgi:hypothetical protein